MNHYIATRRRLWAGLVGLLFSTLTCAAPVSAQVQLDWKNRPKDPKQSISLPDLQISKTQMVTFSVTDINDIFYNYTMTCTKVASASVDLSGLTGIITGTAEENPSPCDTKAADLLKNIADYLATPQSCGDNCSSVSVTDTTTQLTTFISSIDQLLNDTTCTLSPKNKTDLTNARTQLNAALGLSHQISFQVSVDPGQGYSCTISEFSKQPGNKPTKDGTLTVTIGQTENVVTLSVGPLFSAVQNRTYSAVTVPGSGASGTNTVLGVQGRSLSTSIAALVNLRLPIPKLSAEKFGVDISAGPVLRLNSASGTSPAGFFGGLSLRFYRYLFLTPGFHVGQFADFPQGFTHAGQGIPPNFGTLTPVTRTTVKFGLAITFQTKDFSSLNKGKTTATSGTAPPATAGSAKPASPAGAPTVQPNLTSGTLTVSSTSLDFGQVKINGTKALTLNVTNGTASSATLNPSDNHPHFTITGCGGTLAAGKSCPGTVTFAPTATGSWTEFIVVTAGNASQTVQLTGTGTQ